MSDKTVLITGATGQLGRQTVKQFERAEWNVVGTGFSRAQPPKIRKLDLTDEAGVIGLLDELKPKALVHCAAERSPDVCSNDPDAALALNVTATRTLATACKQRNILLIYISTDYVFSGAEGEAPYEADAKTAPPNFYGESKLAGEKEVLEQGGVVMRVPVLYGETERWGESAVNTLVEAVLNEKGKENVEMDAWSVRYPTNTEDVGRVLKDVVEKYLSEDREKLPKILQFSSEDRMTKYEICKMLGELLGVPTDHLVPNEGPDPNASVQRPYDCHLSTKNLKDIGISVKTLPFRDWWQRYLQAHK